MGGPVVATFRLKYVNSFMAGDRMRHYFRRNGKTVRLPGVPGSPEFMAAYAACLAEQRPPQVKRRSSSHPRSFDALAALYYGSADYAGLSKTSKGNYRRIIDHFLEAHGHRAVPEMTREHVSKIIGGMSDRPGAAITLLKRIRTLLRFALDLKWIDADPTYKIRSYASVEIHTWTEDEITQFETKWPIGSKPRLAFALLLYTGQRGSDVRRMGWPDIAGDAINVTQQKTKAKLLLPLHPSLQQALAVAPRSHVAILTTEYGKPFSVKGFGQYVTRGIVGAGLPDRCKPHGLRKAAARRLAEAGCTANQIAAVTGHKTLAEIERYTRAADQARLSREAMDKQVENKTYKSPARRVTNVGGSD